MKKETREKPAIVYCAVNTINKKKYIGVTTRPLKKRIENHLSDSTLFRNKGIFQKAIRKYGRENFNFYTLNKFENMKLALQEEIRLIELVKPEYNSTKGGEGCLGLIHSKSTKEKISKANTGRTRPYKKFSPERVEICRQCGLKRKEEMKKYFSLGPKSQQRKIICVDDGKIFQSIKETAEYYSISRSALNELCRGKRGRKSVAGKVFKYLEDA